MTRPLKYGEATKAVTVRLPLWLVEWLKAEAERESISQGEVLVNHIDGELHLREKALVGPGEEGETVTIDEPLPICKHPRSMHTILNGGLAKCRCGALRNSAGEWN